MNTLHVASLILPTLKLLETLHAANPIGAGFRHARYSLREQKHQSVELFTSVLPQMPEISGKKTHNDIHELVCDYSLTLSVELHLKFVDHLSSVLRSVVHGVSSGGDLAESRLLKSARHSPSMADQWREQVESSPQ
jgi:hypothetical protein